MATERLSSLERLRQEIRKQTAENQPHRKTAPAGERLDHKLENPLGRLAAAGIISPEMYEAGRKFAGIYLRYLESIGSPYPFCEAADPCEKPITGPQHMPSDEECQARKEAFKPALEAVEAAGIRPRMSVVNITVYESNPVDEWDVDCLKKGLKALEDYFQKSVPRLVYSQAATPFRIAGLVVRKTG